MRPHVKPTRNRREFLADAFCGFGSLAMAALLQREQARAGGFNPLAAKAPESPEHAQAEGGIFLFKGRGPSHLETVDPKPLLNKLNGPAPPQEFRQANRP